MISVGPSPTQRLRRGMAACASMLVMAAALLGPGGATQAAKPGPTPTPTPTPTACQLVPQVRDLTLNQGLGAYARLVRGKGTLVRFYLSLPSCAPSGSYIEMTGGTLTVNAAGIATTVAAPSPNPVTPTYPQLVPYTSAPAADAVADPRFAVPGSALAPQGTTGSFTASFSATITYKAWLRSGATPVSGSIVINTRPGTTTPITATVEQRTNALRVLLVPMGNGALSYSSQFSAAANSAVQNGMATVDRIYPVPAAVSDLADITPAGIRYRISPSLLDVSALLDSQGKFCGTATNFTTLQGQLAQFLQSWNTVNSSATADRVVGVVDAAISNGGSSGCAEGFATINGVQAWVRATPDGTQPSNTGALIALEMAHTFGLVPINRDNTFSTYHSPVQNADPSRTQRSYNTFDGSYLVDDRTVMTLSGTWNNSTTLLEAQDYAFLACRLGGATSTECPVSGDVGSATGVAAGPRFVMSGTIDPTTGAANVVESYFSIGVAPTAPAADSIYKLIQKRGNTVTRNDGVPVRTAESNHEAPDAPAGTNGFGLFSISFEFDTGATRIEFWRGTPGAPGSLLLYSRNRGAPPTLDSSKATPPGLVNFTDDATRNDQAPSLTGDGAWLAWSVPPSEGLPSVHVAPTDDKTAASVLGVASTDPVWCPAGGKLAYVVPIGAGTDQGDLFIVTVSGRPAAFGTPVKVYDANNDNYPFASNPTFSPDCKGLAFEGAGNIWRVDATGLNANLLKLTTDGRSHDPSWSQTPGDNRIAYAHEKPILLTSAQGTTTDVQATLASFVRPDQISTSPLATPLTLTVTSTDDTDGATCDVGCTLRQALNVSNANPGVDTIGFNIAGGGIQIIAPAAALPGITDPVTIDARTQPGFAGTPLVVLDGTGVPSGNGLIFFGGSNEIRGLVLRNFTNTALYLGPAGGSLVAGNYIGLNPDGTTAAGNYAGIVIGSDGNIVGGTTVADRNVISGNSVGVGIGGVGTTGNVVAGNYVGTNAAGTAALPNSGGVIVDAGAVGNLVGGTATGAGNLLSGNTLYGVSITNSNNNVVAGNLIGTKPGGTQALGNGQDGVRIFGTSAGNLIGGTTPAARNVISGNGINGIAIMSGGVLGNKIQGNYIGLDLTGGTALANGDRGVRVDSAPNIVIGGTTAGARNVISGNGSDGLVINSGSPGLVLSGNYIGTDATGSIGIGNGSIALGGGQGVFAAQADITIGGTAVGAGNVISANNGSGILSVGDRALIQGNLIGTDATGTMDLGNRAEGVDVQASSNVIGGTASGAGNLISGNRQLGVALDQPTSIGNLVQGNSIGTDVTGTRAIPNDLGGVMVRAPGNTIGGTAAGAGNLISGNGNAGVRLIGPNGHDTLVQGNRIGTDAAGTSALANIFGVTAETGAANNAIGGTASGAGNVIAFNTGVGVRVEDASTGNAIEGNSLHDNGGLGIDLNPSGVTPNDPGDPDTGSNNLQNFPVIQSANSDASQTTVLATLNTEANKSYRVEFFSSPTCETPLGNGEGQTFIGFVTATTNGSGNANVIFNGPPVAGGNVVTATTTAPDGSTSEFSGCATVASATATADLQVTMTDSPDPVQTQSDVTYSVVVKNNGPDGATNVQLVDTIPAGTSFQSSNPTCLHSVNPPETVTCDVASLASDASMTWDIVVRPTSAGSGTITNTASVDANELDPNNDNNTASQTTTVNCGSACSYDLWALNPSLAGSGALLHPDGESPAWGTDQIVFSSDADIFSLSMAGQVTPVSIDPSREGRPAIGYGIIAFERTTSDQDDIWLLRDKLTYTVIGTTHNGAEGRLDLLYTCPGKPTDPVFVGLAPSEVNGATNTFRANVDTSRTCANGVLTPALTDGIDRVVGTGNLVTPIASEAKDPVAAATCPAAGQQILQYQAIVLCGSGKDAEDGQVTNLTWTLDGSVVGSGSLLHLSPPAGGWAAGPHAAIVTAHDSSGATGSYRIDFTTVTDADNDGIPASVDNAGCLGPNGDGDPTNAWLDPDGDGIPSVLDTAPCTPQSTAYDAQVNFDPNTLYIPSTGKTVTITIRVPYRNVAQINSVQITAISGGDGLPLASPIPNIGKTVVGDSLVVKFDRQKLITLLQAKGVKTELIYLTVEGSSSTTPRWSFIGRGSTNVQPAK